MSDENPKIIIGLRTLAKVLGVGVNSVNVYMKMGLPGKMIAGKWHFHWSNIENWFEDITKEIVDDPDNIEEEIN